MLRRRGLSRAFGTNTTAEMTKVKIVGLALAVLVTVAFALTVWPTRYRYDHVTLKGSVLPVRMDRLTGHTEILRGMSGWSKVSEGHAPSETAELKTEVLPPEERAKVTGNAGMADGTLFQGKLYNGSTYDLFEVVMTLTAREPTGAERWSRQFRDQVFIRPLTTGAFQIEVTGAQGAKVSWRIDSLKGMRSR